MHSLLPYCTAIVQPHVFMFLFVLFVCLFVFVLSSFTCFFNIILINQVAMPTIPACVSLMLIPTGVRMIYGKQDVPASETTSVML